MPNLGSSRPPRKWAPATPKSVCGDLLDCWRKPFLRRWKSACYESAISIGKSSQIGRSPKGYPSISTTRQCIPRRAASQRRPHCMIRHREERVRVHFFHGNLPFVSRAASEQLLRAAASFNFSLERMAAGGTCFQSGALGVRRHRLPLRSARHIEGRE